MVGIGMTKIMTKEILVQAPLEAVWHAWTTAEGLSFVSGKSNVDLEVGGRYEWFLDLEPDEQGRRGSEGSKVLAWFPKKMIAFSWTFPPDVYGRQDASRCFLFRHWKISTSSV